MTVATKANVRTAEAARHGMPEALKIASPVVQLWVWALLV